MDTKIEIKQKPYCQKTVPIEGISKSKVTHGSDVQIKEELTADIILQPKGETHSQDNNMDIKEPIRSEATSGGLFESEAPHSSGVQIKNESTTLSSDDVFPADSESYRKVEIKEEPVYSEITFPKLKPDMKDEDLHFNTEDKASEEYQELTESSRLDVEAVQGSESDFISAELYDSVIQQLRENTSSCPGKTNANVPQRNDIADTFHQDDKVLHKCKFCGKCFSLASNLQTHIVTHEDKGKHKCSLCEQSFTLKSELKRHNLQSHATHEDKGKHKCSLCEQSFTLTAQLKRHNLQSHVTCEITGKYKCTVCEESFTLASQLKNHYLQSHVTHEITGKYKCNLCEKSFTWVSQLKRHNLQLHTTYEDKGKYKCNLCEKNFTWASQLKRHNLQFHVTFEDTGKYKCNLCEKNFTWASQLKRHNLQFHVTHEHKGKQVKPL